MKRIGLVAALLIAIGGHTALSQSLTPRRAECVLTDGSGVPRHRCQMLAQAGREDGYGQRAKGHSRGMSLQDKDALGKQRKHIEQLRLLKLLEFLDLDENQDLEFIMAFHAMRRRVRTLDLQKQELVRELADGLGSQSLSDKETIELVTRIIQVHDDREALMADFLADARRILTPAQVGKLVIFQERFELEMLEQVRAFRDRKLREEMRQGADSPGKGPWPENDSKRR